MLEIEVASCLGLTYLRRGQGVGLSSRAADGAPAELLGNLWVNQDGASACFPARETLAGMKGVPESLRRWAAPAAPDPSARLDTEKHTVREKKAPEIN